MKLKKRVLIAPLNWGLGHATRCIPIINALTKHGFKPIIASDGAAFLLLKKEFPKLEFVELPSYNIKYSKKGKHLKIKLLKDVPNILSAIKSEQNVVKQLMKKNNINGIISDNRYGVYNKNVPSVFLTHQLNVLSGNTTWLSTKLNQKAIKNYNECWIPDYGGNVNLSGTLGHSNKASTKIKYIGPISRFDKVETPKKYKLMVLLSGPEPQRTILEEKLLLELKNYKEKVVFIKGVIATDQLITTQNNIRIYNYMTSSELETTINSSELIVSRSGYTTIMDLVKLEKKAFFIPTPGQFEQLYLAEKFKKENIAPFCNQEDFTLEKLRETNQYKGFSRIENTIDYQELFSLF